MEAKYNQTIRFATVYDQQYADDIANEMTISALLRNVEIEPRTGEYIFQKMIDGLAVIAIDNNTNEWMGFCALDVWSHEKYVANTGLIVKPKYRGMNVSSLLKHKLFDLARLKYPEAKIFSLTSNSLISQINFELGFRLVSTQEMISDPLFTIGINSWVNFVEMMSHADESGHKAMVFVPDEVNVEMRSLKVSAI